MRWSERLKNYILGLDTTKRIYESIRSSYVDLGDETRVHTEEDVLKRLNPLELIVTNLDRELERSKRKILEQKGKITYLESLAEEEIARNLKINYFNDFAGIITTTLEQDYMIFLDPEKRVLEVTPTLALFLGYQNPDEIKGQSFSHFSKGMEEDIKTLLETGEFKTKKVAFSRKGKKVKKLTTSGKRFELSGKVMGLALYVDRSKVKEYLDEIYEGLSTTFEERAKELIYQLKQRRPSFEM